MFLVFILKRNKFLLHLQQQSLASNKMNVLASVFIPVIIVITQQRNYTCTK